MTILLRVNHGRWIADCPRCNSALMVQAIGGPQLYERFACFDCGYGLSETFIRHLSTISPRERIRVFENEGPFFQIPIQYPDEREMIEGLLVKRESVENQNWEAGETVRGLIEENLSHGVIF